MIAPAQNREQTVERRHREDVSPMQAAPDTFEALYARLIWLSGEIGSVDCADRCADDQVRHDACSRQGLEHAHPHGAEAAAARQHECRLPAASLRHTLPFYQLPGP